MSAKSATLPPEILDSVIHGDCREILPALPPCTVDLIFADPPYNLQLHKDLWRPNLTCVDSVYDPWDRFSSFAEYDRFTREWLLACRRVLKDTGTLWVIGSYHNIYRVGSILQDLGYWILNDVVWIKSNPTPNFLGTRLCNAHEILIWAARSRKAARYTFHYRSLKASNDDLQMRSDWYLPICTGAERLKSAGEKAHTTQKPEALLHRIIRACSNPGDVVLDPFFGTGTTGAVAKRLGRRWIGIECDETYVRMARARIEQVVPLPIPAPMLPPPLDAPRRRIPFGMLLEYGLIAPGTLLRLGHTGHVAIVMDDGTIACNGHRGSIHRVGSACLNKPVFNGWKHWYYQDPQTGEYFPLETLREMMRAMCDTPPGLAETVR
ncbi:MAG: DNA methyltransferase [Chloroherpetonaceae bacterium]|nr:DNA methyltransferase [Chthonomonadaceae bacterium]MDW8206360.1 DNA methyltransferase [Chloroherpetonaceae bacterium]